MKKLLLILFALTDSGCLLTFAQSEDMNPFAKFNYDANVVVFGAGVNSDSDPHVEQAKIIEIGSVMFDTELKQVVGFADENDNLKVLNADATSTSIDPHCEKYYWISPYAYCFNNPVRFIDPDGRDVYGFDVNTGQLSLTTRTDDDYDRIMLGTYDDENGFVASDANDPNKMLDISKGVLLGEYFENIAESGLVFSEGFLGEGINTMDFLSFNSNIEFNGWAYSTSVGDGLAISPWSNNTDLKSMDLYSSQHRTASNTERVGYLGEKLFHIHTHPGTKDGRGGYGKPSPADLNFIERNPTKRHYISSKRDGITIYKLDGSWGKYSIY